MKIEVHRPRATAWDWLRLGLAMVGFVVTAWWAFTA